MNPVQPSYCLVLSGGGAKGVYHLGVWRALKELGVEVEALVGTSIGAIMAAFFAQGDEAPLRDVFGSLSLDTVFELPGVVENGEFKIHGTSLSAWKEFLQKILEKRGLDTSPLRNLLAQHLDETAVRGSGKDLGLVTVNLSDLTPQQAFLEDIEPGRLIDYLMASAAFPGFEQPVIDGKRYIDGGLHDNIPFALARARGYRRIIVSDISGAGRNRKIEVEGGMTVYIRCSIKLGGVLDFDRGFLEDFEELGYLDTLKAFGCLAGSTYFVEPNPGAEVERRAPKHPGTEGHTRTPYLALLECAAQALELGPIHQFTYQSFEAAIRTKQTEVEAQITDLLGKTGNRKALVALLRQEVLEKALRGSPYQTWRLVEELFPGSGGDLLRGTLRTLFPDLEMALGWLRPDSRKLAVW